jgi:hypothetical protein
MPAAKTLLLYFCRRIPRVILLVFVLVSAAIDDKNGFKIVIALGNYRPGAPIERPPPSANVHFHQQRRA